MLSVPLPALSTTLSLCLQGSSLPVLESCSCHNHVTITNSDERQGLPSFFSHDFIPFVALLILFMVILFRDIFELSFTNNPSTVN